MRSIPLLFAVFMLAACEEPAPVAPPQPAPPTPPTATASAAAAPAPPPGHAPKAPVAIEEFFKIRRLGDASLTADEKTVLYISDVGGRADLWSMPAPPATGAPKQLTHVTGFIQSYAPSPTRDQLVFETDKNGDELPHLYLTNTAGDAPKDLAADYPAGRRTQFIRWSADGKKLYFLSSARDEKFMDLVEYDVDKKKAETLFQASQKLSVPGTISPDGKRWIVQETINDSDTNLYLVERGKADKPELLTKHEGEVQYDPRVFSKDGKTLYFGSDKGREYVGLYAMDLAKKTETLVAAPDADVEEAGVSNSYRYFYTSANVDGTFKVTLTDTKTKKEVALPAPPGGGGWSINAFSRSERYLTAMAVNDTSPRIPYVIDLKENKATAVGDPMPQSLKGMKMIAAESVKIPSFDGKNVPAFVYRPAGDGPFPAVIDVHGGPTSQSRRIFFGFRQYLVSKGYVVIVPNVRGSTGYGKTYTKLDNLDLGGGPLKDIVACKKWLVANAKVAADKVVVEGGSYGGYMALAAATFTPDEFAANVDYFGVSDLKSLVESFPPYWASFATFIYAKFGDPKNPAHAQYQHDRSPINFIDKITKPLLVVQGDKDARVKKDQSDRVVESIKKHGTPVHYLVLENEGHGFSRNQSYIAAYQATDRFLDRYLWNDTSVEVFGK
jgi:dipeptidyl aminopeptidase/acylaminoacyl peptidase